MLSKKMASQGGMLDLFNTSIVLRVQGVAAEKKRENYVTAAHWGVIVKPKRIGLTI